jgi:hypothetical protein
MHTGPHTSCHLQVRTTSTSAAAPGPPNYCFPFGFVECSSEKELMQPVKRVYTTQKAPRDFTPKRRPLDGPASLQRQQTPPRDEYNTLTDFGSASSTSSQGLGRWDRAREDTSLPPPKKSPKKSPLSKALF